MNNVIDMIIFCPKCGHQHVDREETDKEYTDRLHESSWWELGGDKPKRWDNPPHKSHLCHHCRNVFRLCDIETNGIKNIKTHGESDTIILP